MGLKEELDKRIYTILKRKNNADLAELEILTKLYIAINKNRHKTINFTDLIPSVFFICATSLLIAFVIKLL